MKSVEPIFVHVVDNSPYAGRYTDRHKAMEFLKSFGIKLAKDDIFANILPNMLDLTDYETQYMSDNEIRERGFQEWISRLLELEKPFRTLRLLLKSQDMYILRLWQAALQQQRPLRKYCKMYLGIRDADEVQTLTYL